MKTHLVKKNGNKKLFPFPSFTLHKIQWQNTDNEKIKKEEKIKKYLKKNLNK